MKYLLALICALACTSAAASLCETGLRQSPVNISAATQRDLPPLEFDYHPLPLKIADDGHTTRVRFDNASRLRIGKQLYRLQQFHLHTPGGDQIDGEQFPLAAHLLHKSDSGQLLAVVVLFRSGAENAFLAALMPLIPTQADGDHTLPNVQIDATRLLPTARGYYRYSGSLTASPCTEGVEWIVLKQALEVSPQQLQRWHQRYRDNMRATRPLHQRMVLESR